MRISANVFYLAEQAAFRFHARKGIEVELGIK